MPKQQEVRGGYCPVADAERPLAFRGTTEALSGYTVRAWTCRVCGATIHEPVGDAPFGRHRRVDCPIECLGKGAWAAATAAAPLAGMAGI